VLGSVRKLRAIGVSEGISFLVLLLIAMPLKYYFDFPLAVKVVGWAHGVLFILYIVVVLLSIRAMKWTLGDVAIALIASLVPGGTLYLDRSWKRRQEELEKSSIVAAER
jgi:integral membrane protein